VINISAGSVVKSQIVEQMLYRAMQAGIQVVGSAGNSGTEGVSYPARSSYSIAVTGVSDDGLVRADAASYGREVDAGAPSVRIVAPFPRTRSGYGYWTGTSFAAPLFSAAVALGVQSGMGRARDVATRALQTSAPYAYVTPECYGEVGKGIVSIRALLDY
jgi:subtilisin family serine protease